MAKILRLSLDAVRGLCPECAVKMEAKGVKELKVDLEQNASKDLAALLAKQFAMPEDPKLERCIQHLVDQGKEKSSAIAICRSSMDMAKEGEPEEELLARAETVARQNGEQNDKQFALQTVDIDGKEIFAVGTWNGDTYTLADLDALVDAYERTKGEYVPFLKLGHDDSQALAKKSGLAIGELPMLGVIENMRRHGDKLIADFKNVPAKLAELIKAGAYRPVSAEIWTDIKMRAGKFRLMLKAVGILGADAPAVSGLNSLDDLIALYSAGPEHAAARAYKTDAEVWIYDFGTSALNTATEEEAMNEKVQELEKQLAESGKQCTEAKQKTKELQMQIDSQNAEGLRKLYDESQAKIKEMASKVEASEKALTDVKQDRDNLKVAADKAMTEKQETDDLAAVDKLILDKKISPAQKAFAIALLKTVERTGEKKFKLGDKEFTSTRDMLLAFVDAGSGVALPTGSSTELGRKQPKSEEGVLGVEMDQKAKEYQEEHKGVSYRDALIAVSRGDKK